VDLEPVRKAVASVVDHAGLLLVEVGTARAGRRRLIRILVDRPGRITVDECADLSREISDRLDSELMLEEPYVLEVSSPGVGRELTTDVDWRRSVGRTLRVLMKNDEQFEAELTDYDGSCLSFPDGRIVHVSMVKRAVEVL
jgi:ribosome maturation factor RimP